MGLRRKLKLLNALYVVHYSLHLHPEITYTSTHRCDQPAPTR